MMHDLKHFEREGLNWVSMIFQDKYTEVQVKDGEDWQDKINALLDIPRGPGYDNIWWNGEIVRVDHFGQGNPDTVAEAKGYRAPYKKPLTSRYRWNDVDGRDAKAEEFNVPADRRQGLMHWWATKEDGDTEEYLKLVRMDNPGWNHEPNVPGRRWVYASLFDRTGHEHAQKDIFVQCVSEQMREFCDREGLTYPVGETLVQPWCYGLIWNSETGAIEGVKGYVRYKV